MALATALCVLSPVSLLALCALSEYNLFDISENFAAGLGLCILLALVAVAVVLFMQCGAAVKPYEFLEKEPIDTEYGVTGLVQERRDAFAARYNSANTLGTVLCILAAVPLFAAMMCNAEVLSAFSVCLLLVLVACGVYAFVWAGTIQDAMDQLLETGDFTRDAKARKEVIRAVSAAYWLVVVAIFLFTPSAPYERRGQPHYSWFIWAIAGVFAAVMVVMKAAQHKKQ